MEKITSFYDFNCPNCKAEFNENEIENLCEEPFNGTIIECERCNFTFSADLLVKLTEINE